MAKIENKKKIFPCWDGGSLFHLLDAGGKPSGQRGTLQSTPAWVPLTTTTTFGLGNQAKI